MAKELAKNCELARLTPERIELTLSSAHQRLLEGSHKERLKAALQKHFGANVQVAIAVGSGNGNSPAQLAQRDRDREQEQANAAMESDPFVQSLVDELGGQIQSIKPLQSQEPT
jgi:DNA polymerase-3 subunit gamma/tau